MKLHEELFCHRLIRDFAQKNTGHIIIKKLLAFGKLNLPIYLEPDIREFVENIALKKGKIKYLTLYFHISTSTFASGGQGALFEKTACEASGP